MQIHVRVDDPLDLKKHRPKFYSARPTARRDPFIGQATSPIDMCPCSACRAPSSFRLGSLFHG